MQPGHAEIVLQNNEEKIEFYKIIKQKDCKSYSKCRYDIISRKNEYKMTIFSCSFSNNTEALKIENGNVIINTGIRISESYCLLSLVLKEIKTSDLMLIDISGGGNLNKYLIRISFSNGTYKLEMDDRTNSYKMTETNCTKRVFNKEFSNQPLGQIAFTRKELDSVFKNLYYKECRETIKTELVHSLKFYTENELNMYEFVKLSQKEIFVLYRAEINSNNTPLKVKNEGIEVDLKCTKKKIAQIFDLHSIEICDTLQIISKNGSANHQLYFKDESLKKIVLNQNIN